MEWSSRGGLLPSSSWCGRAVGRLEVELLLPLCCPEMMQTKKGVNCVYSRILVKNLPITLLKIFFELFSIAMNL